MYNERSLENLRPFHTLPPEEQRELSHRGGIASGARRREIAELKADIKLHLAAIDLVEESREEYRRAILRYVTEERKKAAKHRRRGAERHD